MEEVLYLPTSFARALCLRYNLSMAKFRRSWGRYLLIAAGLALLYFFMRLTNLTKLPIFTDEAIYIRWSQIGSIDPNWRFISLVDGKQPLFTWILMGFLRVVRDPLFAGRLVSVFAGLGTTIGIFLASWELFKSKKIAFVSSLLYIVIPFGLMYDRMALYDSLSATFSIWSLYFAIRLARENRLDLAMFLGFTLGFGVLNKTSGFLNLYMLPGTLLLFDWTGKNRTKRLFQWGMYAVVAAVITTLMYSILRLSPLYAMIAAKDNVFVYSFTEWKTHPFNFLAGNLHGLFDWAIHYLTWPLFIASILAGLSLWKWPREKLLLLGWWLAPFFALALDGKVLYPRFILFMVLPLMILAAVFTDWGLTKFRKTVWLWVILAVLFFGSFYTDFYIITNPLYAPIPEADAGQYINDWPSGWGIPQVNAYLAAQAEKGKISVYTDGTFGLLPYAIEIYLVDNPNVTIKGLYPIDELAPDEILAAARLHNTYIVFNQQQIIPPWPLQFIAKYQKGNRPDVFMRLYQVIPTASPSALLKPKK